MRLTPELAERKRLLKSQLKKFDQDFMREKGRMPHKAEKEPIRHLYKQYNALNSLLDTTDGGGVGVGVGVNMLMDEQLLHGHNADVRCLALSRSNGHVASGSKRGSIIIHSTSSNKVEYRADNVFANGVYGLCYLPNGSLVACGYDDEDDSNGILKVFSPSLELVQTLEGHDGEVGCVTISPSGSHLASGGGDGKLIIWSEPGEGGEWARVQVLEDHTDVIFAVFFSPDGKQLATGSWDTSINLYSFNEGNAILAHTLEGHTHYVYSLSFSPDCKLLCSGSGDTSIKFWNPADGSLVKSIDQAHTSIVYSVSYSPNGRILVSAGYDYTMKIWDAETFELKHTFEQEFITVQLTVTADSNFIVSANTDHTVRITPCREYHLTGLTPILNLILHIVYKWEFVSFLDPNENTSILEEVMKNLGELVHNVGYNVASEILSFLSPAHLPVQITPTRWTRDPERLIKFMRAQLEGLQKEKGEKEAAMEAVNDMQRVEIEELRQRNAELELDEDSEEEDSEVE